MCSAEALKMVRHRHQCHLHANELLRGVQYLLHREAIVLQGRTQDLTKGGAHAHAQIIDGCGLSYCTRTRSERQTANTSARYTVGL